ncbi:hypothetical protein KAOT1_22076 [Kordia algicida OT-1]|uniref:Uncharacterized protein n=1 Tax=Kordia algicida OT-1 TaxID=391587 RepID=A9E157_9FLAO|nr:hypothetical protein KAOT1_22076 [Kordia algicida OT-1]
MLNLEKASQLRGFFDGGNYLKINNLPLFD